MLALKRFSALTFLAATASFTNGCAAQGTQVDQTPTRRPPVIAAAGDQETTSPNPGLADPALANKKAPDKFRVKFTTTKGDFVLEVVREWSPNGADRFYNMVDIGYFNDTAIFRAIEGFMFQFGIHGDPAVNEVWSEANFNDDPEVGKSNLPGFITFAKTGAPNSRSTQLFINLGNNANLDNMGFTPFGQVIEGMEVIKKINTEYGENDRSKDIQGDFKTQGNAYILKEFPNLDLIKSVTLIEE